MIHYNTRPDKVGPNVEAFPQLLAHGVFVIETPAVQADLYVVAGQHVNVVRGGELVT